MRHVVDTQVNLEALTMYGRGLMTLPASVGRLTKLTSLTSVPKTIGRLHETSYLTSFPPEAAGECIASCALQKMLNQCCCTDSVGSMHMLTAACAM